MNCSIYNSLEQEVYLNIAKYIVHIKPTMNNTSSVAVNEKDVLIFAEQIVQRVFAGEKFKDVFQDPKYADWTKVDENRIKLEYACVQLFQKTKRKEEPK